MVTERRAALGGLWLGVAVTAVNAALAAVLFEVTPAFLFVRFGGGPFEHTFALLDAVRQALPLFGLLATLPVGFYLAGVRELDVRRVLAGYLAGGVVFGYGVYVVNTLATNPRPLDAGRVLLAGGGPAVLFGLVGALGVLGGDVLGGESDDGSVGHGRW